MKRQYIFIMFILCFSVWTVVVDNVIVSSMSSLKQDVGAFSRYRVKDWPDKGKLNLLPDELLVYAHVKGKERLYYIDHSPYFEAVLKSLSAGTPVQVRYAKKFPKVWKKSMYDLRVDGQSLLRYSPGQLKDKQDRIWKFTGIMGGVFLFLCALGFINKSGTN